MWSGDAYDKAQSSPPWVGAAGPHSVMPFGSVLSIPGINRFVFRNFKGGTASVLSRVPLLRYLYLWGTIDVAGKSLSASLRNGYCVGVVCDGIAGIFKCSRQDEAFFLKNRKVCDLPTSSTPPCRMMTWHMSLATHHCSIEHTLSGPWK